MTVSGETVLAMASHHTVCRCRDVYAVISRCSKYSYSVMGNQSIILLAREMMDAVGRFRQGHFYCEAHVD